MMNVARLFAYTRAVEEHRCLIEADRARERIYAQGELQRLESAFDEERTSLRAEIDRLNDHLKSERTERQYLNDRLCQKLGLAPIHEPSPGEAALREAFGKRGSLVRSGPRATAIAAGTEAFDKEKAVIKAEVDEFLKMQPDKTQPDGT